MFKFVEKIIQPKAPSSIITKASSFFINLPEPHSKEYLDAQKKVLNLRGKFAETNFLPQGTKFVASTVQIKDLELMGGIPFYPHESIYVLSAKEREVFAEMKANYKAKLLEFSLPKDTLCIESKTDQGAPVFYIHYGIVIMSLPVKSHDYLLDASLVDLLNI